MSRELLIVDDDPVVQHLLGAILEGAGHSVKKCSSGAEAISLIGELAQSEQLPDLIFLDLQLSDMAGTEVLKVVRELGGESSVPTVMLSANQKDEILRDHPEAAEADAFLEKPFPPDAVIGIIEEVLTSE